MQEQASQAGTISYHLVYTRCRKPDCLSCLISKGHGPYWFASTSIDSSLRRIYIGKKFRSVELSDFLRDDLFNSRVHREEEKNNSTRASEQDKSKEENSNQNNFKADNQAEKVKQEEINLEEETDKEEKKQYFTDRIDVSKIKKKTIKTSAPKIPPAPHEFRQDFYQLKQESIHGNLKKTYRKLIKKYHPDQYPPSKELDSWMAEINGYYQEQLKKAN